MGFPPKKSTVVPTKKASPTRSAPALGNRPLKKNPNAPGGADTANGRTGQPPVQPPKPEVTSDKPAAPGAEPKLMPEAEQARKGGMMARIAPAPPGTLPETPDPRTSYQVKPNDDTSPLIKIGPQKASPKPAASGIDAGPQSAKPEAKAIPPSPKPSALPAKEK